MLRKTIEQHFINASIWKKWSCVDRDLSKQSNIPLISFLFTCWCLLAHWYDSPSDKWTFFSQQRSCGDGYLWFANRHLRFNTLSDESLDNLSLPAASGISQRQQNEMFTHWKQGYFVPSRFQTAVNHFLQAILWQTCSGCNSNYYLITLTPSQALMFNCSLFKG